MYKTIRFSQMLVSNPCSAPEELMAFSKACNIYLSSAQNILAIFKLSGLFRGHHRLLSKAVVPKKTKEKTAFVPFVSTNSNLQAF